MVFPRRTPLDLLCLNRQYFLKPLWAFLLSMTTTFKKTLTIIFKLILIFQVAKRLFDELRETQTQKTQTLTSALVRLCLHEKFHVYEA